MSKRILLTGGLGSLGSHLVPLLVEEGNDVWLLVRRNKKQTAVERVRAQFPDLSLGVMEGDIDQDLPIPAFTFDAIWHAAAIIDLSDAHEEHIWQTNFDGTLKILRWLDRIAGEFTYVGTAYTDGRNEYERSKALTEEYLQTWFEESQKCLTVFKPSIIIGTPDQPGPLQGVTLVAKAIVTAHRKVDAVRRFIQEIMLMPPLQPLFRLPGNPDSHLNIIPVDVVAREMVERSHNPGGIVWITNPNPPTVDEVACEIGNAFSLSFRIEREFKASLVERLIERETRAMAPYLRDDQQFPSDLPAEYRIPPGYVQTLVTASFR